MNILFATSFTLGVGLGMPALAAASVREGFQPGMPHPELELFGKSLRRHSPETGASFLRHLDRGELQSLSPILSSRSPGQLKRVAATLSGKPTALPLRATLSHQQEEHLERMRFFLSATGIDFQKSEEQKFQNTLVKYAALELAINTALSPSAVKTSQENLAQFIIAAQPIFQASLGAAMVYLFDLILEPDEDDTMATFAVLMLGFLAKDNAIVFETIDRLWEKLTDTSDGISAPYSRMLAILEFSSRFHGRTKINALAKKHPEEASLLANLNIHPCS